MELGADACGQEHFWGAERDRVLVLAGVFVKVRVVGQCR